MVDIVERARSSAKALRENTVYSGDGDAIILGVQADEFDEAADEITRLRARVAVLESREPISDKIKSIDWQNLPQGFGDGFTFSNTLCILRPIKP